MSLEPLSILVFSFNTQSIRYNESLDPGIIQEHRSGNILTTWKYDGEMPDFWLPLVDKIRHKDPIIVVIGFQEAAVPGDYFHSHFLPAEMSKLGYKLFETNNLMGIGRTTINGLSHFDPFVRGLCMSIYIRLDKIDQISQRSPPAYYTNSIFRNKGATAIYLNLRNNQEIAIINTHFPFNAESLTSSILKKDMLIRDSAVFEQNIFFNNMYRKLVLDRPVKSDHVILLGDLNYRIQPFSFFSARSTGEILLHTLAKDKLAYSQLIRLHDELYQQLNKKNIYPFSEGVQNMGPQFAPTCKMVKNRNPNELSIHSYSTGKADQRVPSHCDRILYQGELVCNEYERFDSGNTNKSDHTAVWALLSLN